MPILTIIHYFFQKNIYFFLLKIIQIYIFITSLLFYNSFGILKINTEGKYLFHLIISFLLSFYLQSRIMYFKSLTP